MRESGAPPKMHVTQIAVTFQEQFNTSTEVLCCIQQLSATKQRIQRVLSESGNERNLSLFPLGSLDFKFSLG